jgi:hypothetical protein
MFLGAVVVKASSQPQLLNKRPSNQHFAKTAALPLGKQDNSRFQQALASNLLCTCRAPASIHSSVHPSIHLPMHPCIGVISDTGALYVRRVTRARRIQAQICYCLVSISTGDFHYHDDDD